MRGKMESCMAAGDGWDSPEGLLGRLDGER